MAFTLSYDALPATVALVEAHAIELYAHWGAYVAGAF